MVKSFTKEKMFVLAMHITQDLNKGDTNNLTLRTGDLGYKDKDGYYYVVGRKDRLIKINGLRINLSEVEKRYNIKNEYQIYVFKRRN